jgi:hypothetical protein
MSNGTQNVTSHSGRARPLVEVWRAAKPKNTTPYSSPKTVQQLGSTSGGRVTFEFDAAKNQMILKRRGMAIVFTKEK